jgi:hypothetical protein
MHGIADGERGPQTSMVFQAIAAAPKRENWLGPAAVLALAALLLAACSKEGPPEIGGKGLSCVDDSQHCIAERGGALNNLMADKQRGWVRQPAPAAAYASGVRLFAFKQKKRELSCDELSTGRREADAGPGVLRGPDGRGLTTAQVARGVMLAQEVSRELSIEQKRRCKA